MKYLNFHINLLLLFGTSLISLFLKPFPEFPNPASLPVSTIETDIRSFGVFNNSKKLTATWETTCENKYSTFILECSTNGYNFQEIKQIRCKGDAVKGSTYSVDCTIPKQEFMYFRLREKHSNGEIENLFVHLYTENIQQMPDNILLEKKPCIGKCVIPLTRFSGDKKILLLDFLGNMIPVAAPSEITRKITIEFSTDKQLHPGLLIVRPFAQTQKNNEKADA